jgi:hypothetical protein
MAESKLLVLLMSEKKMLLTSHRAAVMKSPRGGLAHVFGGRHGIEVNSTASGKRGIQYCIWVSTSPMAVPSRAPAPAAPMLDAPPFIKAVANRSRQVLSSYDVPGSGIGRYS